MCRNQLITYLCGHSLHLRLSTCLANFTFPRRQNDPNHHSKPGDTFCNGKSSLLQIPVHHLCGPCSRIIPEQDLANALRQAQNTYTDLQDSRRVEAQEHHDRELYELHQRFPRPFMKNLRSPNMRWGDSRVCWKVEKSGLKHEVKSEYIVEGEREMLRKWWEGASSVETEDEDGGFKEVEAEQSGSENEGWFPESLLAEVTGEEYGTESVEAALPVEERRSRKIVKGGVW